jgi:hypothetical protein
LNIIVFMKYYFIFFLRIRLQGLAKTIIKTKQMVDEIEVNTNSSKGVNINIINPNSFTCRSMDSKKSFCKLEAKCSKEQVCF